MNSNENLNNKLLCALKSLENISNTVKSSSYTNENSQPNLESANLLAENELLKQNIYKLQQVIFETKVELESIIAEINLITKG